MNNKFLLVILSLILPPLGVFFAKRSGKDLIINIVLTLLFFVPGLIHALYLVLESENKA